MYEVRILTQAELLRDHHECRGDDAVSNVVAARCPYEQPDDKLLAAAIAHHLNEHVPSTWRLVDLHSYGTPPRYRMVWRYE